MLKKVEKRLKNVEKGKKRNKKIICQVSSKEKRVPRYYKEKIKKAYYHRSMIKLEGEGIVSNVVNKVSRTSNIVKFNLIDLKVEKQLEYIIDITMLLTLEEKNLLKKEIKFVEFCIFLLINEELYVGFFDNAININIWLEYYKKKDKYKMVASLYEVNNNYYIKLTLKNYSLVVSV